jgi:hypothetical protein
MEVDDQISDFVEATMRVVPVHSNLLPGRRHVGKQNLSAKYYLEVDG